MKGGHFLVGFAIGLQGMSVIQAGRSQVSVNTLKKTSVGHFVHRKSSLHLTNSSLINLKIVPAFFFLNEIIVFPEHDSRQISSGYIISTPCFISHLKTFNSFSDLGWIQSDQTSINSLKLNFSSFLQLYYIVSAVMKLWSPVSKSECFQYLRFCFFLVLNSMQGLILSCFT